MSKSKDKAKEYMYKSIGFFFKTITVIIIGLLIFIIFGI